jgi:hypothetical protein
MAMGVGAGIGSDGGGAEVIVDDVAGVTVGDEGSETSVEVVG